MDLLDAPASPRPGEELEVAALTPVLAEALPGLTPPLRVGQFPAGHSNLTYLLTDASGREYVLRRPPLGELVKSAHDMGREYRVLSALHPVYAPAPRPILFVADPGVIGAPFYVMERVRGVVLRKELPSGVPHDPTFLSRLADSFVDEMARIHAVDFAACGLGDLGRPEGYVARQVNGWIRRYEDARTEEIPEIDVVADWLVVEMPTESGVTLIHNDFKYDNLVLDAADPARVLAVLDWEMATLGDPLMDLGVTLGYWVEAGDPEELREFRFGPTHLPGSPTRRELAQRYGERTGRDVSGIAYHYCYGLFRNAVVLQQLYARALRGFTRDERLAALLDPIRAVARLAADVTTTTTA